ncbi:hypothetical protein SAMN05421823_10647 [Catalinimonas alkaloidigena]|uniref:Uncharacterized protein n=2 Tax=Catalinimonas alkaloidigena TaxID=1075417 RepID=A0A1G9K4Z2_9BACT|nr:hypothetical protein SAMN05421823_10647 [Catalinimonas alkaloidigena]
MALLWNGCTPHDVDPEAVDAGYAYFPLEIGQYQEYVVDSIGYSVLGKDSSHFELREVVTDSFVDLTGEMAFRIERFRRAHANVGWPSVPDSVWTARRTAQQALRIENNITFVRLIFPPKNRATWNVNVYNPREAEMLLFTEVGDERTVGDSTYAQTLKVVYNGRVEGGQVIEVDSNLLGRDVHTEVYARGVGLVEVHLEHLEYATENGLPVVPQRIGRGVIYRQRLVGYGKE